MGKKKITGTVITKDKVFELAKKYNLEYKDVSAPYQKSWWEFYLPVGYVDDIGEDNVRDNLFTFDEDWMNEKGEYTSYIAVYTHYRVICGLNDFKAYYYDDDCANVFTMEELESIVSEMVKLGSRWCEMRKEMKEMKELFKLQKDFK